MKRRISFRPSSILSFLPFPPGLIARAARRDVTAFLYHIVSDEPVPHVRHLYPYKSTRQFEHDLRFLEANFEFVDYGRLLENRDGTRSLPSNAAVLTFDDGFSECFSVVRPILATHGIPCIFFLPETFIDNRSLSHRHAISLCVETLLSLDGVRRRDMLAGLNGALDLRTRSTEELARWMLMPGRTDANALEIICRILDVDSTRYLSQRAPFLTVNQVRQMSSEGFIFGGHSKTHRRLQSLGSAAELEDEIVDSCEFVKALAGQERVPFAFPYSGVGIGRDQLKEIVTAHPFIRLFFDTQELRRDAPFVVHRVSLDSTPFGVARHLRGAGLRQLGLP